MTRPAQNSPSPPDDPKDARANQRGYRSSDRHEAVRRANRSETAEDYVEAIADLIAEAGKARVRDLATCFGVSHVTVSRTIDRLQRDGLVTSEPYRSIELTARGLAIAKESKERHSVVLAFLRALGVSSDNAELDAEGMEHHVGSESLQVFRQFIERAESSAPPADLSAGPSPPPARPDAQLPREDAPPDRFQRVREAHATELVEDYVEAIGDLIAERGQARVSDLARHFGVSHVTVSRTTGRLQRDGYITTEPYRPILLTPKGRDLAHRSRERHRVVLAFFLWLGVPPKAAEIDAEGVEHHVSEETLARMAALSTAAPPRM